MILPSQEKLRVIIIGLDSAVFKKDSAVSKRLIEYGVFCEEIHDFVLVHNKDIEEKIIGNLFLYPIFARNKLFLLINLWKKVSRVVRNIKNNHTVVTVQDPFFLGLVGFLLAKFYHLKFHTQVHLDFFSVYYRQESFRHKIEYYLGNFILKRADGIRVVSQKLADYCQTNLNIDQAKIDTIPVSVGVENIITKSAKEDLHQIYPQFSSIILMASRLEKGKNIIFALDVFRDIIKKIPSVGLVLVGKGSEKNKIEAKIKEEKMSGNIVVLPWSDNVYSLMKTSDIFLISSDYEGWAMTAVEASACGVPVVMTNVGCANEFIKNGKNGIVVGVRDSLAMGNALVSLLLNRETRKEMGDWGVIYAKNLYSNEQYVQLIINSWNKAFFTGIGK